MDLRVQIDDHGKPETLHHPIFETEDLTFESAFAYLRIQYTHLCDELHK